MNTDSAAALATIMMIMLLTVLFIMNIVNIACILIKTKDMLHDDFTEMIKKMRSSRLLKEKNMRTIEKVLEIINTDLDKNTTPAEILALKKAESLEVGLNLIVANRSLIIDFDITKHQEIDWSKVPMDAEIYVRHKKGQPWATAHFAYYENGYVYAYPNGKTSFTADWYPISWEYAKLANAELADEE